MQMRLYLRMPDPTLFPSPLEICISEMRVFPCAMFFSCRIVEFAIIWLNGDVQKQGEWLVHIF